MSATYSDVADQRHSLRMIEGARLEAAIGTADRAAADDVQQLSIQRANNNPIVVAIRNKEPAARSVGQYFSRESQCVAAASSRSINFGRGAGFNNPCTR